MRRLVSSVLLAVACLLAIGATAPVTAGMSRDARTKQNVRLLKTYIDAYAAAHGFVFPSAAFVRKGGGLPAPLWPANPWSGRPMAPGKKRGGFTYAPASGRASYTLVGRLSTGVFTVSGGAPPWLADERRAAAADLQEAQGAAASAQAEATAARQERDSALAALAVTQSELVAAQSELVAAQSDLAAARSDLTTAQSDLGAAQSALSAAEAALSGAQADLSTALAQRDQALADLAGARAARDAAVADRDAALADRDAALTQLASAKDAATRNGLGMIQEVLRGLAQSFGVLPTRDTLAFAVVGSSYPAWPYNPIDGQRMSQGPEPGQFTYTPGADGSWTLAAHLTVGDYTVTQGPFDWAARKDQLTIQGATFISYGLELETIMQNGLFPDTLSQLTLSTVDPWPHNPFFSRPMVDGSSKGDFDYTVTGEGTGYHLVANLTDGSTYDVGVWTQPLFSPLWRLRISLKDLAAQGYTQVLRDYVEQWRLEHGVLPTIEEMSANGAVGTARAWWPLNPWTLQPMSPGTGLGCFEYTPGAGGSFTVILHQQPLPAVHGDPASAFPETYTAQ